MSNPWTPGPWSHSPSRGTPGHGKEAQVFDAAGDALLYFRDGQTIGAEADANARLIAAAPEMAEALEAWIEPWNGFDELNTMRRCDPATWKRIKATRALLARIRGE